MHKSKQRSNTRNNHAASQARRKVLTTALLGAGAATASLCLAPERWSRPVIQSVTLPAHAQTSIELGAGGWFGGSASMLGFRDAPPTVRNLARRVSDFLVTPARAGSRPVTDCQPFLICIDRTGNGNEIQVRVGFDNMTGGVVVDTQTFTPNPDLTFNRNFSDGGTVNLAVAGEYAQGPNQWFGTVQGNCGDYTVVYNEDHGEGPFTGERIQVASASDSLQLALAQVTTVNDEWIANQTDCSFDH